MKFNVKNFLSKKAVKPVAIILVLVIVGTVVLRVPAVNKILFGKKSSVQQRLSTVKKGAVKSIVSGSGAISFTNSYKIYSKTAGTVLKVNYKEGDTVKAGAVIYELDQSDAQSSLDNSQSTLEQSQISAASSDTDVSNLLIKAPFSGQVSTITVSQGDTVAKGGTVMTITDTSKLKVLLSFNAADIGKVAVNQTADVYVASLMQSVSGTVTYVSNEPSATSTGGKLYTVEIQMNNPGALIGGMSASAEIHTDNGDVSSTNTATMNYLNKQSITSLTGGTVESINVKENQQVDSGTQLIIMKSDDISRAKESADLKISAAQTQIDAAKKQLAYFNITAPADGMITTITYKVGDTVKVGDQVSAVVDPTQMQFDIAVDELDIAKLAVGQKADITLDALSGVTVKGEVSKLAVQGTSTSGVSTFPVTVKIDNNLDKIKGGMNANADIVVSDQENVVYVPIEAITTVGGKSFVRVKESGSSPKANESSGNMGNGTDSSGTSGQSSSSSSTKKSSSTADAGGPPDMGGSSGSKGNSKSEATVSTKISGGNGYESANQSRSLGSKSNSSKNKTNTYYAGTVLQPVQVGVNDGTNIEIKSGLDEGQQILLPELQTSSKSTSSKSSTKSSSGMGGMGGPGGGF